MWRHFVGLSLWFSAVAADPAAASYFCRAPYPPGCADGGHFSNDDWSSRRCRTEIRSYLEDVERYADCLERETQSLVSKAREDADQIVRRFNCKLEKRGFCF